MTRRIEPSERDLRATHNLVWQCYELRDDKRAARQHLVDGIAKLVNAHAVMEGTGRWTMNGGEHLEEPVLFGPRIVGEQLRKYHDSGLLYSDPFRRASMARKNWTGVRRQLVDDDQWYSHVGFGFRQVARVDEEMKSVLSVDSSGTFSLLTIQRGIGAAPFTVKEIKLVEYIHRASVGVLKQPQLELLRIPRLTPTEQETLRHLLLAQDDREIAVDLGKSVRTVNESVSSIFKKFGVRNRKELLALFISPSVLADLRSKAQWAQISGFAWLEDNKVDGQSTKSP